MMLRMLRMTGCRDDMSPDLTLPSTARWNTTCTSDRFECLVRYQSPVSRVTGLDSLSCGRQRESTLVCVCVCVCVRVRVFETRHAPRQVRVFGEVPVACLQGYRVRQLVLWKTERVYISVCVCVCLKHDMHLRQVRVFGEVPVACFQGYRVRQLVLWKRESTLVCVCLCVCVCVCACACV